VALAKNKKLVLSVGLNMLLAIALSVLLYFVYAQFVTDLDTVSNWGRYSVRTYRTDSGLGYFDVWVKPEGCLAYPYVPRRAYSRSGERAFYVEAFGADLTGKGVPDLVVQQWYGSAHSDSQYLVLELDGPVVREVDAVDHLIGVECKDLNDDGVQEVTGVDDAYGCFLGDSYAASPFPRVVLSFDRTQARFVLDKKLMSKLPLSQDQLEQLCLKYKTDSRWSEESRPPSDLFVTMLDLTYTGNEKQAWELFDASWPDGSAVSREQYRQDVRGELSRSHFYPAIAGWNKAKS
jgi:hypothetical protein